MQKAGEVVYADAHRRRVGEGWVIINIKNFSQSLPAISWKLFQWPVFQKNGRNA